MSDIIKFVSLGGLDENGKNMYCFEINEDIYIVECGLKYPETQNLGIDIEIPSFDYLIENKHRVKALFVTHAHPDTMGAIQYLLKEVSPIIYATQLTSWIIEDRLKEANIKNYKIKRIKENSIMKMESGLKVHSFKTTHSIVQSVGIAFETSQGYVVFTSDFIFDFAAKPQYRSDLRKLIEMERKGVLALFTESVGASKPGFTAPNHRMSRWVEPIISKASSRVVITVYTHSLFNVQEIANVAIKYNYRILFFDKELQDLVHKHNKLDLALVPPDKIAPISDIDKGDVMVIISGNGIDLFEKLAKIASKADETLKPGSNDTFIIASPPIPGVEHVSIKAIDDISRLDSDVFILSSKQVGSMHASKEDLKMMISILNPKFYVPIKGEYTQLVDNADLGYDMNISKENIVVLENGEIITFNNGKLEEARNKVKTGSILIDGQNVNDSQTVVLKDRLTLSNEGTVIIGIGLDRKTKEQVMTMDIQTRGFIYIKDSEHIINSIRKIVNKTLEKCDLQNDVGFNDAKGKIRSTVQDYIKKETGKEPIILTMIITV
ncbi:ribonuclease J [Mycoplasma sp. P36-A1]|uniref:ribonuclease J n=1 Tax=Mycoplasma sp. P36-A1 TaxID=3252900 RepID=UPI003C2B37A1